jgi:hypothetical protein
MIAIEERLVVERIDVRHAAGGEQKNHRVSPGRMVTGVRRQRIACGSLIPQQGRKRQRTAATVRSLQPFTT